MRYICLILWTTKNIVSDGFCDIKMRFSLFTIRLLFFNEWFTFKGFVLEKWKRTYY